MAGILVAVVMLAASSHRVIGGARLARRLRLLGWLATVIMLAAGAAFVATLVR